MKVFYKKKVGDQIIEANMLARRDKKEIEYIELTEKEYDRLKGEIGLNAFFMPDKVKMYTGIELRIADEAVNTCAAEIKRITDEELRLALTTCRHAPVAISQAAIASLKGRLGGRLGVMHIPQENRREFLDGIDRLLLASLKRETV